MTAEDFVLMLYRLVAYTGTYVTGVLFIAMFLKCGWRKMACPPFVPIVGMVSAVFMFGIALHDLSSIEFVLALLWMLMWGRKYDHA